MINGQLPVRPSKIVAGHEPEKTNEFLQAMGMAILSKVSHITFFCYTLLNEFSSLSHCLVILKLSEILTMYC